MKIKNALLCFFLLAFASCGSLRVLPNGCRTDGTWGDHPIEAHGGSEIQIHESYFIFFDDHEVKLKDLVKEAYLECNEIKKIRVEMHSSLFIKRELNIYITKK